MTGKFGVDGDFMTGMVMCARTPFFLTTAQEGVREIVWQVAQETQDSCR